MKNPPAPSEDLGAMLIARAVVDLRKSQPDLEPLEVLDFIFDRYRRRQLFPPNCVLIDEKERWPALHPRSSGLFPTLLAAAFSPWKTRSTWRKELVAAEAASDLAAEDALLTQWSREVVAPFAHRRSLF